MLDLRAAVMEFVQETLEVIRFAVRAYFGYLGVAFVMEEALEVALFLWKRYSQYFESLVNLVSLKLQEEVEEVEELVLGDHC